MSLRPPETVGKLQATLHAKAKGSPDYRFYTLYDKVYRSDVLAYAYRLCRHNGGAEGVDGQSFEDIETFGRDRWLDELTEELRTKRYRPRRSGGSTSPSRASRGERARSGSRRSETGW